MVGMWKFYAEWICLVTNIKSKIVKLKVRIERRYWRLQKRRNYMKQ